MVILQVLPELNVGGVETGVVDLASGLIRRGHRAVVVSGGGRLVRRLEERGATHITLPVHVKSPRQVLRMARAVARVVQQECVDVIHARSRIPALIGFLAARQTGARFVTTCHGYYAPHLGSRVMGWGRVVITPSHALARYMMQTFGVPHDRLRVIPRGVDLAGFPYREPRDRSREGMVVGMLGRLTPGKGYAPFVKAFSHVARRIPKVRARIIGDPPVGKTRYREELALLMRQYGVDKMVEVIPAEDDVPRLLEDLDLVVFPSLRNEAFGRVVIEAGAAGVPVVATRIEGPLEIVQDGETGLLADPGDPTDLARAIITLLSDRALARRVAQRARAVVEARFTADQMVDATVRVYEEVLAQQRILIIKMSAVGDVILATPSVRAIRRQFPTAHISVLVGRAARQVPERCPDVDDVLVLHRRPGWRGMRDVLRMIRTLLRAQLDLVVDLQNTRLSQWLAASTLAPQRVGCHRGWWSWLLTDRVRETPEAQSPIARQARLLAPLGICLTDDRVELWPSATELARVERWLAAAWVAPPQRLVGVCPGTSRRGIAKRWPPVSFAQVCDRLARAHLRAVLLGSPEDRPIGEEVERHTRARPLNWIGRTTIMEAAAVMRRCAVVVTADSAALHMAAGVGTPSVALFGTTDPARIVPPGVRCHVLEAKPGRGMPGITARAVAEAVQRWIGPPPVGPSASDEDDQVASLIGVGAPPVALSQA